MPFTRPLKIALAGALLAPLVVLAQPATPADAVVRKTVMSSAASFAHAQGYQVGIAVLDTKTGHFYGSGDYRGIFASESIVKVFIAARLLVRGEMYGRTKQLAYKMITQSDDGIASSLYGRVGGDSLIDWVKSYFHVPSLGYRPTRAGWWGNTHIRPSGLVRLYAKLKANHRVGPWLLNAMHHATKYGSDGTYQFFGIPSATKGAAIKQGWGNDAHYGSSADFNTSGFVNNNRYAVAILAQGPASSYGTKIGNLLTSVARRVLPGGTFPDPLPRLTRLTKTVGRAGGGFTLTVHGTDLTHVTAVRFGTKLATGLRQLSPRRVQVIVPAHAAGLVAVRVTTDHGKTPTTSHGRFTYKAGPVITRAQPATGPLDGGTVVTVTGTGFESVTGVRFGPAPGTAIKVLSPTQLQVTAPAHEAAVVDLVVVTAYGTSAPSAADHYTYAAASPSPPPPPP
jgi:hypothetical protein